jgi:transcriptional regulator with XRE-family HTH domain
LAVNHKLWEPLAVVRKGDESSAFSAEAYFIQNMKWRRESWDWSQADLALALRSAGLDHMHQTTVSRIESGERPVRVGEASVIAEVLRTPLSDMVSAPAELSQADRLIKRSQAAQEVARLLETDVKSLEEALAALADELDASLAPVGGLEPVYPEDLVALARRMALAQLGDVPGEFWRGAARDLGVGGVVDEADRMVKQRARDLHGP